MTIGAHLDHLGLGSPNPQTLAQFYAKALRYRVREQDGVWICEAPARRVAIEPGDPKELKYIGMVMDSERLSAYRSRLDAKGVRLERSPSPLFGDQAFAVTDPDGNKVVFGSAAPADGPADALRARLQHVGIATPAIEPFVEFYTDTLGFIASDHVVDDEGQLRTSFLRTDHEHHVLAAFQASKGWFDHHCYEAEEWNQIRDWADYLATHDISLQWGPGRHGPGNNLFFMIHDPDDNWLEISAELEVVEADRPTGRWRHQPKTLNSWGQAFLRK